MTETHVAYETDILRHTYELLKTNSYNSINIPHSDVFYVRAAIIERYGECLYSLDELESIMMEFDWTPSY